MRLTSKLHRIGRSSVPSGKIFRTWQKMSSRSYMPAQRNGHVLDPLTAFLLPTTAPTLSPKQSTSKTSARLLRKLLLQSSQQDVMHLRGSNFSNGIRVRQSQKTV